MPEADPHPLAAGNRVRLSLSAQARERLRAGQTTRWVFSGCGGADLAALGAELYVGRHDVRLTPGMLMDAVPTLARLQAAYRAAGGIHAAALLDARGEWLAVAEDVGRHNAVDKAIGLVALAGRTAAALIATGRASSDIVAKAARVGIPIVASFSSSTSLGVQLAGAAGVTLIGYLRRQRLTIYTHPQRIVGACACDKEGLAP